MYEYKVIPAPLRTAKVKGLKTTSERFAHLLESSLNEEAGAGWEFLRAETMPCEERKGLTGTAKSFQTMLVFRRSLHEPDTDRADETDAHEFAAQRDPGSLTDPAEQTPRLNLGATRPDPAGRQEPVLRLGGASHSSPSDRSEPVLRTRAASDPGHDDDTTR